MIIHDLKGTKLSNNSNFSDSTSSDCSTMFANVKDFSSILKVSCTIEETAQYLTKNYRLVNMFENIL